tara:strand:- start:299 stop:1888 length:1590 start_codon:yes stop_codon:yes gene_type:complete
MMIGMPQSEEKLAEFYMTKFEKAKTIRQSFEDTFDDCYEFAMPMRETFKSKTVGERKDEKIFDETAVVGVQEFASRLQQGLVPNFARWADFTAGSEVPKEERDEINNELDEVTEYVFEILQNSNFSQEVHESFMDLAIGTGILHVSEGDAINPVSFSAIPLPHVVLDVGPDDKIDHVYRERSVRYSELPILFPDAVFDGELANAMQSNPDVKTKVLEVVCKNYNKPNEDAFFCVIIETAHKKVLKTEDLSGNGANPYICFRWSKCSGEVYGRGPLMNALSAIKTTNLTVQYILENAAMSIAGIYQMDDDGVINPDTINLVPGTVIPKAPNSMGLQPIRQAGSMDFGNFILSDMRNNIKKALYNDMLGNPDRTPASATEIAERMADLSRRIGSAFGRLQAEMVQPVLQRVVYILKKQGRIELPTLNGRQVKVRSVSPLAQSQSNADITAIARWLELIQARFGPEITNLLINAEETAAHLAKKFGVPDVLIRDIAERKQLVEMAQRMAQQTMQQSMQQPQMQEGIPNEQAN